MYERNECGCLGLNWFYEAYIKNLEERIKKLEEIIKNEN